MKKILVFGGVSYNMMVDMDDIDFNQPKTIHAKNFHETIGSTGAGKALALKKLGLDFKLHGIIGKDKYGKMIKDYFINQDIEFIYDIDPEGTERHLNLMKNDTGERISIFLHAPSKDIEIDEDRVERLVKESDIVLLNVAPYCKRFIPMMQKYKKEIWCDLHSYDGKGDYYDEFIQAAHVILFSSDKNPQYEKSMKEFIDKGKKIVICTHGAKGSSTLLESGEFIELDSLNYTAVDTNGAGDNFLVGFLYGYLNRFPIEKSLKIATITGGLAVTSKELVALDLSQKKIHEEYENKSRGE